MVIIRAERKLDMFKIYCMKFLKYIVLKKIHKWSFGSHAFCVELNVILILGEKILIFLCLSSSNQDIKVQ